MEGIREWCTAVCMAALGCAAMQLLVPKSGTGRLLQLIITTFFICVLVSPLLRLPERLALDIGELPDSVKADLLEGTVLEQLEAPIRDAATEVAQQILESRGVTAEQIEVITDISEDAGIYMQQIVITVDKQMVPAAKAAGEVLARQLNTTVTVQGR